MPFPPFIPLPRCSPAPYTPTPPPLACSFFLAETLKYLYMLQSPDHPISLERYVFNTVRFRPAPSTTSLVFAKPAPPCRRP